MSFNETDNSDSKDGKVIDSMIDILNAILRILDIVVKK